MNNLRICSWNANGLRNRVAELINFLQHNNIDIMMINETRYNPQIKLKIKNYNCIRKDSSSSAGGILILIKNNIPYKEIKRNLDITIEYLPIKLASNIYLIAAYNSPNKDLTTKDLDKLLNIGNKILLIGDLNARHQAWNCHVSNKRGRLLFRYALKNDCTVIFPDEPTHFPENGSTPTTIDIGINKNVLSASEIKVLNQMSSDHNPILVTLESQIKNTNTKLAYDYDEVDWPKFKRLLHKSTTISTIQTSEELENEVQKFTNTIQNCIKQTIPVKTNQQIQDKLPPNILQMISHRNKIRKKWQITRNPQYKNIIKHTNNEIRIAVAKHRNDTWNRKLKKINPRDNSLWRMTKIFKNEFNPIPTLTTNGKEAITDLDKANMLADQFELTHNIDLINNSNKHIEIIHQVKQYLDNPPDENWYNHMTSPQELYNIITKLPNRKAPGTDCIQNIIFKNFTKKPLVQLNNIINASIKLSHFPSHWKTSSVIPILKKGKDKTEPISYRPISLLQTMSKITERVILRRLNDHETKEKHIANHQFGFRKNHSTVQQIVRTKT